MLIVMKFSSDLSVWGEIIPTSDPQTISFPVDPKVEEVIRALITEHAGRMPQECLHIECVVADDEEKPLRMLHPRDAQELLKAV